jgi:hypothetical protein
MTILNEKLIKISEDNPADDKCHSKVVTAKQQLNWKESSNC